MRKKKGLGKKFEDGDVIFKQGEEGDCMYIVQRGTLEVVRENDGDEVKLATLKQGDFFGEMAIFEKEKRSATVRAAGKAEVLSMDRKLFFYRMQDDPTLAFRIMEKMSNRIRELNRKIAPSDGDYSN